MLAMPIQWKFQYVGFPIILIFEKLQCVRNSNMLEVPIHQNIQFVRKKDTLKFQSIRNVNMSESSQRV